LQQKICKSRLLSVVQHYLLRCRNITGKYLGSEVDAEGLEGLIYDIDLMISISRFVNGYDSCIFNICNGVESYMMIHDGIEVIKEVTPSDDVRACALLSVLEFSLVKIKLLIINQQGATGEFEGEGNGLVAAFGLSDACHNIPFFVLQGGCYDEHLFVQNIWSCG